MCLEAFVLAAAAGAAANCFGSRGVGGESTRNGCSGFQPDMTRYCGSNLNDCATRKPCCCKSRPSTGCGNRPSTGCCR